MSDSQTPNLPIKETETDPKEQSPVGQNMMGYDVNITRSTIKEGCCNTPYNSKDQSHNGRMIHREITSNDDEKRPRKSQPCTWCTVPGCKDEHILITVQLPVGSRVSWPVPPEQRSCPQGDTQNAIICDQPVKFMVPEGAVVQRGSNTYVLVAEHIPGTKPLPIVKQHNWNVRLPAGTMVGMCGVEIELRKPKDIILPARYPITLCARAQLHQWDEQGVCKEGRANITFETETKALH